MKGSRIFTRVLLILSFLTLSHCSTQEFNPSQTHAIKRSTTAKEIFIVEGSSDYERGKVWGVAAKTSVKKLIQEWLQPRLDKMPLPLKLKAKIMGDNMKTFIPKAYQDEMKGMAEAVGESYDTIAYANMGPDIAELLGIPPACSTFTVMPSVSSNGHMIVGRNLDYSQSDVLRTEWTPMIFKKKNAFDVFAVGIHGLSGLLTAINQKGVMVSRMTSYSSDVTSSGITTMILIRKVLESATSTQHAVELFQKEARTVASNLMISDGKTATVLEIAAKTAATRSPSPRGILYAANHFISDKMKNPKYTGDFRWPILQSYELNTTKFSLTDVKSVIQNTALGVNNILAVTFDYGTKTLEFAVGDNAKPAAEGTYESYDLSNFF